MAVPWTGLLCDPAIHTLGVGAARPSDFDDHVNSILKFEQRGELVPPIEDKLNQMLLETHGKEFMATWWKGLPDMWGNVDGEGPPTDQAKNPKVLNLNKVVWLWMIAKAWDFVGFGRYRYGNLESNVGNWKDDTSDEDNWGAQTSSWNPGMPMPEGDLTEVLTPLLSASPNAAKIIEVMTEARDMFNKDSTTELPPYAYDMRPEVEWPMRKKDGAD